MNKFWINEKTIVFSSIILLLLFLGLMALMDSWMGSLLLGTESIPAPKEDCSLPAIEIDEAELGERLIYLNGLLIDLPDEPTEDGCIPTPYDIYIEIGRIHSQLNDYPKAENAFLSALSEHEDDFVYSLLADNELRAGHYRQSKKYSLAAIDYRPDEYNYWDKLIYLEKNYLRASFKTLNSLYALAAETVGTEWAYSSHAYFLEDQEKYQEAAEVWQAFLETDPSQEDRYRSRVEWLKAKT